ncbi:MAG TPA: glycogen debranching N-terminal domain-containing protein [Chloroflexota bacterium]|nr:glycogen debranching N-terminal domain-containing protein [Chloroflexota bacterium]
MAEAEAPRDPPPTQPQDQSQVAPSKVPPGQQEKLVENESHTVGPRNAEYAVATGAQDIRETIVIKEEDLFLLTDLNGNVPRGNVNGLGLYHQDTRFLSAYELVLEGIPPTYLLSTGEMRFAEIQELTNPDLRLPNGVVIPKESLTIHRERVISKEAVDEVLTITNFSVLPMPIELVVFFDADFADMFQIRGFLQVSERGTLSPPTWQDSTLVFRYDGIDKISRITSIHFAPSPSSCSGGQVVYDLHLGPRSSTTLRLQVTVAIATSNPPRAMPDLPALVERGTTDYAHWLDEQPTMHTDNQVWDDLVRRALLDLHLLQSGPPDEPFPAAGIPWFATLFGRDSLLVGLQHTWYPKQSANILRLLARLQGTKVDPWRDEQPGKIMHELRRGELAHCNIIPFNPYYGTVDATPLFVILLAEYYRVTADVALLRELEPNLRAALDWMASYGDLDRDGFLEYERLSGSGLTNQGWKDSWDAIMYKNGDLIKPPVALVEVQAYAYAARLGASEIYHALGDESEANRNLYLANWLRDAFNDKFWMEDEGFYCLALDGDKNQAKVISSNPGQTLWCGIVPIERASRIADRLMQPDLFTGWGIRTLATGEVRYNPMGYHVGSVWPHDNSLIALGFKRYGEEARLKTQVSGFFEAVRHFPDLRVPELFCGYDREQYRVPIRYPVACSPQAWAAGATLLLLRAMLGLVPQAPRNELWIVRPELPEWLRSVTLEHVPVGTSFVDLRYQRQGDHTFTEVLRIRGNLRVVFVEHWES